MTGGQPTVELFVRSLQPAAGAGRQDRIVERLDRLAAEGVIADYEVTVWGRQASRASPLAETEAGRAVIEQIDAIENWAADAGVGVDSVFESRVVENELAGQSYVTTVLPQLLLAERVDGDLRFVTPHEREEGVCTVADRLARLEARADVSAELPDGDVPATAD